MSRTDDLNLDRERGSMPHTPSKPEDDAAVHPSLRDLVDAYQKEGRPHFAELRKKYSDIRGTILEEYYGQSQRNGVTLLKNKVKRRPPEYRLELEFEGGSAHWLVDQFVRATRIEERRWSSVLGGRPLLIFERWIFSLLVSILNFSDYNQANKSTGEDLEKQVQERISLAQHELAAIGTAAQNMARIKTVRRYLFGLPIGLAIVAFLGYIIVNYRYSIGESIPNWMLMYSVSAGAIGAVISVMVRISHGEKINIDVDHGPLIATVVGAFRPIIGAIFGVVIVVFVEAGIVPFAPPAGKDVTLFFCGVAFLAGFSERWAQDTILHSGSALKPTQGVSALVQQKLEP